VNHQKQNLAGSPEANKNTPTKPSEDKAVDSEQGTPKNSDRFSSKRWKSKTWEDMAKFARTNPTSPASARKIGEEEDSEELQSQDGRVFSRISNDRSARECFLSFLSAAVANN
jgi:hypothetical protein